MEVKARVVFVLIDGVGDVSVSHLGGFTPLQVADIPHIDALAAGGFNGLQDPVDAGLACGSDTAHMSIFGYDPRSHYRGRGAFESLGAGLEMSPGDIAFKCNFACYNPESGIVDKRRADRNFEAYGPTLCNALNDIPLPSFPELEVRVKYATEHRCGVVVHGKGLSDCVTGTDPLKDNLPLRTSAPTEDMPEAHYTAKVVNELSQVIHDVLKTHPLNKQRIEKGLAPANIVLLRGCGGLLDLPTFQETHGLKGCIAAPTKIIAGLGMSLGMDCLHVPGGTGYYDTAFHNKAEVVCKAITEQGYEFGFVHVKAVDDTGHDRRIGMKVRFLECVDKMIGQIIGRLWIHHQQTGQQFVLVCTGDHSTPVVFGDHSHEPVPFTIGWLTDVVAAYGGGDAVNRISLDPIVNPDVNNPPPKQELVAQAAQQKQTRSIKKQTGGVGDSVQHFDEISAATGDLGRFPGSQIMPLVKQFAWFADDM